MKRIMRIGLLAASAMLLVLPLRAQDSNYRPQGQQIPPPACHTLTEAWEDLRAGPGPAPCTPKLQQEWLKDIQHWRDERRIRIGYDAARYQMPKLKWTQTSYNQPKPQVQDRYLYDPAHRKYTVDLYLDDVRTRYGGIDSVLIWPTYPNMGIDDRNQHDLVRSMHGGVEGVRGMVADFHRRGVKVMFPMMMWDQ